MPARKPPKPNLSRKNRVEIKRQVILPDGTSTRRSFYGRTKAEAEANYQSFLHPPLATNLTEGTFAWYYLNKWLPLKAHLRKTTLSTYNSCGLHVLEEIGHLQMAQIDFTTIASMLNRLDEKVTCRNPNAKPRATKKNGLTVVAPPKPIFQPLGPATVNKCRSIALEVHSIAVDLDPKLRPINGRRVPTRDLPEKQVDVYTPAEMRRLLNHAKGPTRALVLLMGFLGMRLREACAQSYTDLSADGTLKLRSQVDRETGELTVKLKSKYAKRDFHLPDGLLEEIRALCFARGRLVHWTDAKGIPHPYNADSADRDLEVVMKRAKLRILTPHEFRHSFSTWLDENGCPRSIRISLLGQTKRGVHDRYNHADPALRRQWLGSLWDASLIEEEEPRIVEYTAPKLGTKTPLAGAANGRSKLTWEQVNQIRAQVEESTVAQIARDFGIDRKTVRDIRDGKIWKTA